MVQRTVRGRVDISQRFAARFVPWGRAVGRGSIDRFEVSGPSSPNNSVFAIISFRMSRLASFGEKREKEKEKKERGGGLGARGKKKKISEPLD